MIVALWASIAFTVYWLDYFRGPDRWHWLNFKPLNCAACLPVWLFGLFYIFTIYNREAVLCIAAALTAGIVTPLLIKLLSR